MHGKEADRVLHPVLSFSDSGESPSITSTISDHNMMMTSVPTVGLFGHCIWPLY